MASRSQGARKVVIDCVLIPPLPPHSTLSDASLPPSDKRAFIRSPSLPGQDSPEVAHHLPSPGLFSLSLPSSPSPESDEDHSDFEELDSASTSDAEYSEASSPAASQLLARKRPQKGLGPRQAYPQKRIRMQASRGDAGYPAELSALSSTLPVGFCSSTPYCQEKSHVDPSNGCPSTPVTHCAILHRLQMYFGPHGFVCEKCGQIYPPGYLYSHIRSKYHAKDLDVPSRGKKAKQVYQIIVNHLLTSHGAQEDSMFDLPQSLSDTIPGLTPTLSYKCPICSTPRWFKWKSLCCHYIKEHRDTVHPDKQTVQARYIIRPYRLGIMEGDGGRSELSNTVILLPEDWTPRNSQSQRTQRAVPRERPPATTSASHLVAIGWPEYLESLKDADIRCLMQLVEMPAAEKDLVTFPPRRAALERGMGQLNKFLTRYLKDANDFLETCHPSVRRAITIG